MVQTIVNTITISITIFRVCLITVQQTVHIQVLFDVQYAIIIIISVYKIRNAITISIYTVDVRNYGDRHGDGYIGTTIINMKSDQMIVLGQTLAQKRIGTKITIYIRIPQITQIITVSIDRLRTIKRY